MRGRSWPRIHRFHQCLSLQDRGGAAVGPHYGTRTFFAVFPALRPDTRSTSLIAPRSTLHFAGCFADFRVAATASRAIDECFTVNPPKRTIHRHIDCANSPKFAAAARDSSSRNSRRHQSANYLADSPLVWRACFPRVDGQPAKLHAEKEKKHGPA